MTDYLDTAKNLLLPALRQHKHNNGTPGFIAAYDYEETIKLVSQLMEKYNERSYAGNLSR